MACPKRELAKKSADFRVKNLSVVIHYTEASEKSRNAFLIIKKLYKRLGRSNSTLY